MDTSALTQTPHFKPHTDTSPKWTLQYGQWDAYTNTHNSSIGRCSNKKLLWDTVYTIKYTFLTG